MSSSPFKQHGRALIENGYSIVPIPFGTKGPKIPDWQSLRLTADTIDDFITGTHKAVRRGKEVDVPNVGPRDGVGILARNNPAIDIDCYDEKIVEQMIEWCRDNIGEAPVRVGKAPKALLMYVTSEPFAKVTSARFYDPSNPEVDPDRKGQRLEVLGDGQQFVAFHIHPETNKPYQWEDWEDPLELESFDLPTITGEHARLACREFERLCVEAGWEKIGEGSATEAVAATSDDPLAQILPPDENDAEIERVRSALKAIEGDVASSYDYDQWRNVLFALKWTKWDCAESLARRWSETSDKHVTKEFNVVWRGAQKRDRGREITLGTVFKLAKDAGWMPASGMTEEEVRIAFEDIKAEIPTISKSNNTHEETAQIIARMASIPLSATQEGELLHMIKRETGATVPDLRRDLSKARKSHAKEESFMATHAGYAANLIERLTDKSGVKPVAVEGMIYVYSESKGIWRGTMTPDFAVDVARLFDGQENCNRRSDYLAIAQQAYSMLAEGNETFFIDAPVGLACKGRFYRVADNGKIEREELDHTHRQRVLSPVQPQVGEMPLFTKFLDDAFKGDRDNEQRDLLQEVMGSILLGLMARYEKVLLVKGPGRSGKGTLMKIIQATLPREVISAVSPFNWDGEYYLANLSGKRLNVVGELPDDEPIPSAMFKSVTGRDTLTGRHPSHRPFNFKNEAAHIFNSNHFVYTKERSDTFYNRWILMEFRNTLVHREDEQDVDLADKIIANELPAIMAWSLQGAKRLQDRGRFPVTTVHRAMMAQWRHRTSTLIEFLLDKEVCRIGTGPQFKVRRSEFYRVYTDWCKDSNRRPMGKIKLYDEFDDMGVTQLGVSKGTDSDGSDIIRGISLTSEAWTPVQDDPDW